MKKFATLLVIGAVAFMYSCGPSAKELQEKATADSLHRADSLNQILQVEKMKLDSIAKVVADKKIADSIAHADSIAKKLIKAPKAVKAPKKAKK